MLRPPIRARQAQAIPLVMGFAFLASVFVFMLMSIRVEDKKQNLLTFQQLKAYYMAQAAIQHALLKVRILPNETYDASALARGQCPLLIDPPDTTAALPDGDPWKDGLAYLVEDVTTDSTLGGIALQLNAGEAANWSYRIESVRALTTFMKDGADSGDRMDRSKVNVIEFVAVGTIQDKLTSNVGGAAGDKTRSERVTKIIEVTRSSL